MKPKKPNSIRPWRCVILAVDPGQHWAAAIYKNGNLITSDHASGNSISNMCDCAMHFAINDELPLIAVIESHTQHGKWGPQQMAGTAENVGVWKHYIDEMPEMKWTPKVLRVQVNEWRRGMFGHCQQGKHTLFDKTTRKGLEGRDYWKALACQRAGVENDDEAETILIGEYATKWWKVGECAGVRWVL